MPQIGHAPGASRTISGCIGQIHSVFVWSSIDTGSSAIPHFGQAPAPACRISGCIGHVYSGPGADLGLMWRARCHRLEELLRLGTETIQTVLATEVIRLAAIAHVAGRILATDVHPADGIDRFTGVGIRNGGHDLNL